MLNNMYAYPFSISPQCPESVLVSCKLGTANPHQSQASPVPTFATVTYTENFFHLRYTIANPTRPRGCFLFPPSPSSSFPPSLPFFQFLSHRNRTGPSRVSSIGVPTSLVPNREASILLCPNSPPTFYMQKVLYYMHH